MHLGIKNLGDFCTGLLGCTACGEPKIGRSTPSMVFLSGLRGNILSWEWFAAIISRGTCLGDCLKCILWALLGVVGVSVKFFFLPLL